MNDAAIHVDDLSKVFRVPVREGGLAASLKSLVRREHRDVRAVDSVSFDIAPGEVVGFLGPNGAGKTTTMRMLLDIIRPDRGRIEVFGGAPGLAHQQHSAFPRRRDFCALVFHGQRNALEHLDCRHIATVVPVHCKCGAAVQFGEVELDLRPRRIAVAVVLRTFGLDR